MVGPSPENKIIANLFSEAIVEQTQTGKIRKLSLQLEEFEGCRCESTLEQEYDVDNQYHVASNHHKYA